MKANCVVCGKEFEKRSNKKSCGPECSSERKDEIERNRYAANPEKVKEASKKWQTANPEKVNQFKRNRYAANPEKAREYMRNRRAANPEKVNETERTNHRRQSAAKRLGLSPIEYAMMRVSGQFTI